MNEKKILRVKLKFTYFVVLMFKIYSHTLFIYCSSKWVKKLLTNCIKNLNCSSSLFHTHKTQLGHILFHTHTQHNQCTYYLHNRCTHTILHTHIHNTNCVTGVHTISHIHNNGYLTDGHIHITIISYTHDRDKSVKWHPIPSNIRILSIIWEFMNIIFFTFISSQINSYKHFFFHHLAS